jgi:hypothetical protein
MGRKVRDRLEGWGEVQLSRNVRFLSSIAAEGFFQRQHTHLKQKDKQ